MPTEVQVNGLDEFVSRFYEAADALERGISDALHAAGEVFVTSAQGEAPVDTGYLRDHIQITEESDNELVIESLATYSAAQEYGTRYMGAQPYFFQAEGPARQEMEFRLSDLQI